ncbi:hypothetical protein U1Q18_045695, partial [Sarracenia purpurea var. burkii]
MNILQGNSNGSMMDNYKSPNRFSILASQDSEEEPKLVEGKSQARATRKCSDIVADAMSLRINLKNMMRNESLDRDFARFLRTETKSFTAELLRVDKNPDPFSPSKMASLEARIRSLKGLSPVIKEAKKATAEEILINKEEDEQENSPGFQSSPKERNVGAAVRDSSGKFENVESNEEKEDRLSLFPTKQGLTPSGGMCEIRNEKGAELAESDLARKLLYESNVGAREPNRNIDAVPYGEKSEEDYFVDDAEALLSNEAEPENSTVSPFGKK